MRRKVNMIRHHMKFKQLEEMSFIDDSFTIEVKHLVLFC